MGINMLWIGYESERYRFKSFSDGLRQSGMNLTTIPDVKEGLARLALDRNAPTTSRFELIILSEFSHPGEIIIPDTINQGVHQSVRPALYAVEQIRRGADFELEHARMRTLAFLTTAYRQEAKDFFKPADDVQIVPYQRNTNNMKLGRTLVGLVKNYQC